MLVSVRETPPAADLTLPDERPVQENGLPLCQALRGASIAADAEGLQSSTATRMWAPIRPLPYLMVNI
jgi:hypothetical protein